MNSRPNEEQKPNQEPALDLFAFTGGMMNSMQDMVRDAESDEFKAQMDKDPMGAGLGLMFRMLGFMIDNLEKSVVVEADAKPEPQQAAKEEVKQDAAVSPRSPRASNSGMFSPVTRPGTPHPGVVRSATPELYRGEEETREVASPKM